MRLSRRTLLAGIAVVAIAVLAIVLIGGGDDDDGGAKQSSDLHTIELGGPTKAAPAATPLKLSYPSSWSEVPDEQLPAGNGERLAVLRRTGRSGLLVVSRQPGAKNLNLETLGPRLGRQIKSGFSDAREVAARPTSLPAGDAFVYSFVRQKAGTANTVVVIPSGKETYVVNAVVPSGNKKAAQESGEIVRTLKFE